VANKRTTMSKLQRFSDVVTAGGFSAELMNFIDRNQQISHMNHYGIAKKCLVHVRMRLDA
jgi:hypothetical protein